MSGIGNHWTCYSDTSSAFAFAFVTSSATINNKEELFMTRRMNNHALLKYLSNK